MRVQRVARYHPKLVGLLLVGALFGASFCWELSAPRRGQVVAYFDVMRGRRCALSLTALEPAQSERAQMFREQYGVEVRAVPHGIADHGYAAAYNEVMMATVNKRYGRNVFEEIAELEIAGVPYAVN